MYIPEEEQQKIATPPEPTPSPVIYTEGEELPIIDRAEPAEVADTTKFSYSPQYAGLLSDTGKNPLMNILKKVRILGSITPF